MNMSSKLSNSLVNGAPKTSRNPKKLNITEGTKARMAEANSNCMSNSIYCCHACTRSGPYFEGENADFY